jgi:DNA-binding CsgD family transcriptional regulator/tetratricopeptide (TPR) repeat protein
VLVGRKSELATLHALVEGALGGKGGALLITGEPGIGKTALLDDTVGRVDGSLTTLRATGRESDADLPFAVLADLLRPAERELGELPGLQAKSLRRALALEEDGGRVADGLAVGVAVLGVLAALAGRRPVLIVVDDLQWVDESSRAAILFAARRISRFHVALLCAARKGGVPDEARDLAMLSLAGLRASEARELLVSSARVPLDRTVRQRLLEVSAGNPLGLVELPHALSDAQLQGDEPLGEPIPVNGGIERTFGARVARLPDNTKRALLLAAAAGSDADEVLATAFRSEGLAHADLLAAELDGLIAVVDGEVEFRHPLVRSVVYQSGSVESQRAAHRVLADVEEDPDRRAWHLSSAAVAPDEVAAAELDAAAGRALARGAPASAARAFEASAGLSDGREAEGARLARAARAAHRAGDASSAGRFATAARALASDPITLADLLLVESDLRMRAGDLEGAHRELTVHAERLVEIDRHRAATMLLLAAKLRVYRLEAAVAADEVERALEILPAGDHDVVHLVALSMSRTVAGRDGARDAAFAAAVAAEKVPHGHAHTLGIAWPLIWLEEYAAARSVTDRAIALQREAGFLLYLPQSLLPRAELEFRTGDWDAARSAATEALSLFEETNQPNEAASAAALLARIEAARGNAEECRLHAQRALASDVEFGLRSSAARALGALGLLALGSRRPEEAISPLETAERMAAFGAVGEPWLLLSPPDLVEALARAGHVGRAREVLHDFEVRARGRVRVSARAAAARCAGIVDAEGRWQDAFEEALTLHDQLPTPFERARTELCYGERLRRARKRVEARARLRSALALFDALGAAPWSERARTELRASGETARRRSTTVDALTTQELAVARLVVGGASNREAAAALFVSPKTIEFHLGNVYRKLDVRSRTELVRSYAERLG